MSEFVIHDTENKEPLESLWAFISIDEHGREGLCGGIVGGMGMQLVTGRPTLLEHMRPIAKTLAREGTKKVRLVRYARAEIIEEL